MKKFNVSKFDMEKIHSAIPDAYDKYVNGRVSRREFLRFATLLGMSATAAQVAAATGAGEVFNALSAAPARQDIVRGGDFISGMQLQLIDHPARLSWVEGSNIIRHVAEYLTETGPDNITRPYLLEKWEANEDVTEWTIYLKQGITFNNGDTLTADDVIFTMNEWLNPDVGSSMLGLISYWGGTQNIEKVDDYTIKLHLDSGNIGVPEHLFHYPAAILHRSFEGDFIKQPIGTGGFTLEEYAEGERIGYKARTDYWRMGADGSPLPYLNSITYVNLDKDASVAALQAGQIHSFVLPRPSDWLALKDLPGIVTKTASSAQGFMIRMRVDIEPWTDVRVRNALKMCQDREKILQLSYYNQGDLSIDAHVAPAHPEYFAHPIPAYNPEGAKALLAEAGYPDGLTVTLASKNDEAEPAIAQALKEMAAPGGFNIELDLTEPGGYWDRWTEVDFGITIWTHRPLGTMVLPLAYIADADGKPVPWNETRWVDEEFTTKLRQAEGTLDIEARREIFKDLETIMQERSGVANSYWRQVWSIASDKVQGYEAHPTSYDLLHEVWMNA